SGPSRHLTRPSLNSFCWQLSRPGSADSSSERRNDGDANDHVAVHEEGVEPSRFYPPEPKSGASASSATRARDLVPFPVTIQLLGEWGTASSRGAYLLLPAVQQSLRRRPPSYYEHSSRAAGWSETATYCIFMAALACRSCFPRRSERKGTLR